MSISIENKKINKMLRSVFSGNPNYARYADGQEKSTIDILSCIDSPSEGVISFGTIGLSDYSTGKKVDNIPLGVEFVGACYSKFDFFPNIVATCSFNIINSNYKCEPGSIHLNVVGMYIQSPMKNVLFSSPFSWDTKFETLYMQPQKIVAWLQIVPISDEELAYSAINGTEALEKLFEKEQINIFDLFRKSVL